MDIGDTGEDCNLWTTITVMRGKACCKKCFVETEIQWRSWEGETVRLAKGGGSEMKEQQVGQQNY